MAIATESLEKAVCSTERSGGGFSKNQLWWGRSCVVWGGDSRRWLLRKLPALPSKRYVVFFVVHFFFSPWGSLSLQSWWPEIEQQCVSVLRSTKCRETIPNQRSIVTIFSRQMKALHWSLREGRGLSQEVEWGLKLRCGSSLDHMGITFLGIRSRDLTW